MQVCLCSFRQMNAELEAKVADTVRQADQLMVRFYTDKRIYSHILTSVKQPAFVLLHPGNKRNYCLAEGT